LLKNITENKSVSLAFCFFISYETAGSQPDCVSKSEKIANSIDSQPYLATCEDQVGNPDLDILSNSEIIVSETRLSDRNVKKKILETAIDGVRNISIDPLVSLIESEIANSTEKQVRKGLGLFADTIEVDIQIDSGDFTTELQSIRVYGDEDEQNFWFNQGGIIHENDRTTLNLGVGRRTITVNNLVMLGVNAFYDHEFPDHHQRGSIGIEILSTPFQLTGNVYESISGYKSDLDGGNAKPASGHDYKVSTSMPYLPGATLSMEQFKWNGEDGAKDSSGRRLGISGNLSQNFAIRYISTDYDSTTQSDNEEVRLTFRWSQNQKEIPTLFDVSRQPFEFRDIGERKYQLVDREHRIIKQREFSIIIEAI
jgi:hypothetical protein